MIQLTVFNLKNKILRCKRGESIMELLVAMLVFTISLTAITLIIRFSLNFTMRQILEARQAQGLVNNRLVDIYVDEDDADSFTEPLLRFVEVDAAGVPVTTINPIIATHQVVFTNDRDIVAFHPAP